MSITSEYQPKYSVGYEYRARNSNYFIDKIEQGMYYERCSSMTGYLVSRCVVFDLNHRQQSAITAGIGLPPHPECQ